MVFASKYVGKFHGISFRHIDCHLLDLFLRALIVPKSDYLNQSENVFINFTGCGRIRFRKDGGSSETGQPEVQQGSHTGEICHCH